MVKNLIADFQIPFRMQEGMILKTAFYSGISLQKKEGRSRQIFQWRINERQFAGLPIFD